MRRIKEILDKDLRADFKLDLVLFDTQDSASINESNNTNNNIQIGSLKSNFELAKFISLIIY